MSAPEVSKGHETEDEYRTIERTLLQTARGRWFLAEHSRRSRRVETEQLEGAIEQLKSSLRSPPALLGRLEAEVALLREDVSTLQTELLSRSKPSTERPTEADAVARGPTALLRAAEDLHELIWSLQASEIDEALCARIGRQAAAIFAISAQQAAESERARKFTTGLEGILTRTAGLLETIQREASSGAEPPPGV